MVTDQMDESQKGIACSVLMIIINTDDLSTQARE